MPAARLLLRLNSPDDLSTCSFCPGCGTEHRFIFNANGDPRGPAMPFMVGARCASCGTLLNVTVDGYSPDSEEDVPAMNTREGRSAVLAMEAALVSKQPIPPHRPAAATMPPVVFNNEQWSAPAGPGPQLPPFSSSRPTEAPPAAPGLARRALDALGDWLWGGSRLR